jgi:hypothetical protein
MQVPLCYHKTVEQETDTLSKKFREYFHPSYFAILLYIIVQTSSNIQNLEREEKKQANN